MTILFSWIPAFLTNIFKVLVSILAKLLKCPKSIIEVIGRIPPPFCRWFSRTSAFEDVLRRRLYGNKKISDSRRNDMNIVINACELRTGSAFRFGSRESGCWRFGIIKDNDIDVAHAVAASAAYPALLPAMDRKYRFMTKKGKIIKERVLLTDGGVFDNLGISCLEPGRSAEYSSNVFNPDYIICCAAGQGLFDKENYPYWWVPRMTRSFVTVHRKLHDYSYSRLHKYLAYNEIKGFILPFLGQRDERLPIIPPDLVRREEVCDYPTDFAPMSEENITLLSKRGEQLTELLLSYYCPEI
jgi:NTE family protein